MPFRNRRDAGRQLAARLSALNLSEPVVLGLPRGGVPVAAEVAGFLDAPVDVFVARKIGAPGHEELGIGAVAEGTTEPVVTDIAARLGLRPAEVEILAARARAELGRRVAAYRHLGRASGEGVEVGRYDVVTVSVIRSVEIPVPGATVDGGSRP